MGKSFKGKRQAQARVHTLLVAELRDGSHIYINPSQLTETELAQAISDANSQGARSYHTVDSDSGSASDQAVNR